MAVAVEVTVIELWPMSVCSTLALNLPAALMADTISAAKCGGTRAG